MAVSVNILNKEHWHQQRAENVGASEVAALFGYSPYSTKFTLWHQKAGKIAVPEFESERMEWGNLLEPVIAKYTADKMGWTTRKVKRYLKHKTVKGMGASLDYEIVNHTHGVGALEIKNLDYTVFKSKWLKNEDGSIEAPLHIELQLQHQMAVTGWSWGAIAFLLGGNEHHVILRKRNESVIKRIESAVSEFWDSIERGAAPSIEEAGDLEALKDIFDGSQVTEITPESVNLVEQVIKKTASRKTAENEEAEAKARLIQFLHSQEAEIAMGEGYKVTYKTQKRKESIVKASEFRVLRISEMKETL